VRDLQPHPTTDDVPAMRPEEWTPFLADVCARGVQEPLTVQKGDRVLDGRHRLRAARESGHETVPARVVDLAEDEQVAWVYRTALLRRHLSDDQRAVLAARWSHAQGKAVKRERAAKAGRAGGRGRTKTSHSSEDTPSSKLSPSGSGSDEKTGGSRTRQQAAVQHRVPERKVRDALKLEREAPELADKVLSGQTTLAQARRTTAAKRKPVAQAAACPTGPVGSPVDEEASHVPDTHDSWTIAVQPAELVAALLRQITLAEVQELLHKALTVARRQARGDKPRCSAARAGR
jgi:hypothetical protein